MDTFHKTSHVIKDKDVLSAILAFCSAFKDNIENHSTDTSRLNVGILIEEIFHQQYLALLNSVQVLDNLTDAKILKAVKDAQDIKLGAFENESAFAYLVRGQIGRFEEPSLACVNLVQEQLEQAIATSADVALSKLAPLSASNSSITGDIQRLASKLVKDFSADAKEMIKTLVAMELAYINSKHPDFSYEWSSDDESSEYESFEDDESSGSQKKKGFWLHFDSISLTSESTIDENAEERRRVKKKMEKKAEKGGGLKKQFKKVKKFFLKKLKSNSIDVDAESVCTSTETVTTLAEDVPDESKAEPKVPKEQCLSEPQIIEVMKRMVIAYCNLTRKNFTDRIPKVIMYKLVNPILAQLEYDLLEQLYKVDGRADNKE